MLSRRRRGDAGSDGLRRQVGSRDTRRAGTAAPENAAIVQTDDGRDAHAEDRPEDLGKPADHRDERAEIPTGEEPENRGCCALLHGPNSRSAAPEGEWRS